LDLTAKTF